MYSTSLVMLGYSCLWCYFLLLMVNEISLVFGSQIVSVYTKIPHCVAYQQNSVYSFHESGGCMRTLTVSIEVRYYLFNLVLLRESSYIT
jgi:hypothetical protein